MNKETVLEKANSAVEAVEASLEKLNDAENKATELSEGIESLLQEETELLASEESEAVKNKSLLKIRVAVDVKKSLLAKVDAQISSLLEQTISLGIYSYNYIGAIRNALVASRKSRALAELEKLFPPTVFLDVQRYVGMSLPVHEIENGGASQPTWVWSRPDQCLDGCRGLRSEFARLSAMVESDPDPIEIPTPPANLRHDTQFLGSLS